MPPAIASARAWRSRTSMATAAARSSPALPATISTPARCDPLRTSVAGAGDVNGDGRADMLVGIPGANNGPTLDTGRAQLYLGALPPPLMPAFSVLGTVPYGELGLSVAGIGDVNGDGL